MKKGFTLIEILIVISIMALFTAMIYSSFDTSKAKSRDQKRVSDVSTIQLSLEQYFNTNGIYPLKLSDLVPKYLSEIPKDSTNNYVAQYFPISRSTKTDKSKCVSYHLWTKFEQTNPYLNQKKGFDSTDLSNYTNMYECTDNDPAVIHGSIDASNTLNPLVYDVMP